MIDRTLLMSGNDIPFPQAGLLVRQPTVKEISLLTEPVFLSSCQMAIFSKDLLKLKDKSVLDDKSDFEILMSIINDKSDNSRDIRDGIIDLLSLLFSGYEISIEQSYVMLTKEGAIPATINCENYIFFRDIVKAIFCLDKKGKDELEYNPEGAMAEKLADRFKKARQKVAAAKGESLNGTIIDRYVSIISVGLSLDVNVVLNYTLYQLYETLDRYNLKLEYDLSMQARMAGASSESLDKVEHWMKNLHPEL